MAYGGGVVTPAAQRNVSTFETCPLHIWRHEVVLAAIRQGADAVLVQSDEFRSRIQLWWRTGEPAWMAVDSLVFWSKQRRIEGGAR